MSLIIILIFRYKIKIIRYKIIIFSFRFGYKTSPINQAFFLLINPEWLNYAILRSIRIVKASTDSRWDRIISSLPSNHQNRKSNYVARHREHQQTCKGRGNIQTMECLYKAKVYRQPRLEILPHSLDLIFKIRFLGKGKLSTVSLWMVLW